MRHPSVRTWLRTASIAFLASAAVAHGAAELTGVADVTAGSEHACALMQGGTVKCWGRGSEGGMGNGVLGGSSAVASDVVGLTGMTQVVSGYNFNCALTSGGGVKCWGRNLYGELGNNSNQPSALPVDVVGLSSGVASIAAGEAGACAVTSAGAVKCWGSSQRVPADVPGLASGVAAVTVGFSHWCALTTGGAVKCWGANSFGQLGNAATSASSTPVDAVGLGSGVISLSAGDFYTCAVTGAGAAKCWGRNSGRLGDGTSTDRSSPTDVVGLSSGATSIAAGGKGHTCALVSGGAKCWGSTNGSGQLGDGSTLSRLTPVDVSGLSSGVTRISAGHEHTCAVTSGGAAKCWGAASYIGVNVLFSGRVPTDVFGLPAASALSAGASHMCALTPGGGVKCWGGNESGQVGDGTTARPNLPADVVGLSSGVVAISASGAGHSCAVSSGGSLKCWGRNSFGQVGDGTGIDRLVPVNVTGLSSGIVAVANGGNHTCALTASGGVKCWGWNHVGQLGDGSFTTRTTPVDVVGLSSGVTAIVASYFHTCALTSAGAVKCWGISGQVGDGANTVRPTPVDVVGLSSGVAAIAAATGDHTCALTNAGAVWCWGANDRGQLGDGTTLPRNAPVAVSGLASGAVAIAAGGYHSCALLSSGAAKCWGYNLNSALGDFTGVLSRPVPSDVVALSGATAIVAGGFNSCALVGGTPRCWGDTLSLGARRYTPSAVLRSVSADVSVTQLVPSGGAIAGKDLQYSLTVTSAGPDFPPTAVAVTIPLPGGAVSVWSNNSSCVPGSGSLVCYFGSLVQTMSMAVVVRPATAGTYNVTAIASAGESDPSSSNNTHVVPVNVTAAPAGVPVIRWRLYSDITKEHHFTTDLNEYDTLGAWGWHREGPSGRVLDNPGSYNGVIAVPYYRLYDTRSRWHHWTTDANEYYTLKQFTYFSAEGVDGYILPTQAPGTIPLYRLLYPPVAGLHHWTIDGYEYQVLTTQRGWVGEGGSGFVIP